MLVWLETPVETELSEARVTEIEVVKVRPVGSAPFSTAVCGYASRSRT
jgi:hypothetical protein